MLWLSAHGRLWRTIILTLLLIALIGPWGYDHIHVPAQYGCAWPNFRLEGDFCGTPLSGLRALATGFALILSAGVRMVRSATLHPDLVRNLWSLFVILIPLPIFSTPLLLLRGEGRRRQGFQVMTWVLAAVGGIGFLLWFSVMRGLPPIQVWGLWLYILLALLALILEMMPLAGRRRFDLGA